AGETEYTFRHLLVRDVAYGQIPRAARVAKHRAAAAWIESLARPEDHAETLAHHYSQALALARATGEDTDELVAETRVALRNAGDRAYSLGSVGAARDFYRSAWELWPASSLEWAQLIVRYRRPTLFAELERKDLVRARDVLLAQGDLEVAAEAELYLGWDAWNEGRGEDTSFHHSQVLALADQLPPSHTKAYLLGNLAIQLMLNAELDRALETAGQSLEIAEQLGLDDIRAHALNTIGVSRAGGRDRGGLAQLEQSLTLSLELNHAENIIRGYKNLGSILFDFGELERVAELTAQAEAAAARFGDTFNLRWFEVEQAVLRYLEGRWDEALQTAEAFLAEVEGGSPHYMEAPCRDIRALMLLARGDVSAALADTDKAVEFGHSSGEPQVLLPALAGYTCALVAAGRVDEAGEVADELLAAVRAEVPTSWASDVAVALRELGRGPELVARFAELENPTPWEAGATAVASGDFSRAIDIYAAVGARPHEAEARLLAGKLAADGDADAREQIERALAFYRSVRAVPYIREAEQLLEVRAEAGRSSA
ncbi:MAG: hypothetical protein WBB74_01670, partial [Gaiellaceae bacterium]